MSALVATNPARRNRWSTSSGAGTQLPLRAQPTRARTTSAVAKLRLERPTLRARTWRADVAPRGLRVEATRRTGTAGTNRKGRCRMRKWVSLVAVLATAVGGLAATAAPASGQSATHVIPRSHAPWATPSARAGSTSASQRITFRVYLNLADAAGAERTAQAVSTPGSASYRHFLTSAQVNARFAPS